MSFVESDRMSGVSGSIIRELFKMTAAPDMISFAGISEIAVSTA